MQERYNAYIEAEEREHQSAEKLGLKECVRCGLCCLRRPCIPLPSEMKSIADFLGLEVEELAKKYTTVDKTRGADYFLRWIKAGQEDIAGEFMPWERTYDEGYCVFYSEEEKICRIYPVRPADARMQNCWEELDQEAVSATFNAWNEGKVRRFLPNFED